MLTAPKGDLRIPAIADPALGERVKFSLIIPTYNESKNIPPLIARLEELLEGPLGGSYELIVVDDDSPDRTWEIAQQLCENLRACASYDDKESGASRRRSFAVGKPLAATCWA